VLLEFKARKLTSSSLAQSLTVLEF